jgi:hypothetical protein
MWWTYSLYICLQELRIISFSVVNMTEKLRCCQLDLGCFLAWKELFTAIINFSVCHAIWLHCLIFLVKFNWFFFFMIPSNKWNCYLDLTRIEIRIIFEPLEIAIFQLCLLPNMRLSVVLEGRYIGYQLILNELWCFFLKL